MKEPNNCLFFIAQNQAIESVKEKASVYMYEYMYVIVYNNL